MGNKIYGIQLSDALQEELCEGAGLDYNNNRTYEFSYSIGGIVLTEHTPTEEVTNEVLIPYTENVTVSNDKSLASAIQKRKKRSNRMTRLYYCIVVILLVALIGAVALLLYLL